MIPWKVFFQAVRLEHSIEDILLQFYCSEYISIPSVIQ